MNIHPMTLSTNKNFIRLHFHPPLGTHSPLPPTKNNIVRVCVKAYTNTDGLSAFWVLGLHVEHRRPKAGDAPYEGLLKVERRGFRV